MASASRLRPTPEVGVRPATDMPAQSFGPTWTARSGRQARLALRDAVRRGDREGALRISLMADQANLPAQAQIGSAEGRMALDYQSRQADQRVLGEQAGALDAGRGGPTAVTPPAAVTPPVVGAAAGAAAGTGQAAVSGTSDINTPEPVVAPVVAPGASPVPENPVSGATQPQVNDVRSRLASRGDVNPLTRKPFGYRPGAETVRTPASGSIDDFTSEVRRITATGVMRGEAVRQANQARRAAGKPDLDYDEVIDTMFAQDRSKDAVGLQERKIESSLAQLDELNTPQPRPVAQLVPEARTAASLTPKPQATQPEPQAQPRPRTAHALLPPLPERSKLTASFGDQQGPKARAKFLSGVAKAKAFREQQERELAAARAGRQQREEEANANIRVPDWQQGTVLGRLNQTAQRFGNRLTTR